MRMGELLDQSIRLYRKNFFTFIGIIALVYVPVSLLPLLSSYLMYGSLDQVASGSVSTPSQLFNSGYLSGMGLSLFSWLLNAILVQGLGTAALTRAIADNYLGKTSGIFEAYKRVGKSWLSLVGALIIAGLIYIGVIILAIIPCVGWFVGPGLAVYLIIVVIGFIAPAVVIEKTGATVSLRRAWDLGRRRFWWLMGYRALLLLFSLLIVSGPTYLAGYLVRFIAGSTDLIGTLQWQSVAQTLTTILFGLLYVPVQLTAITLAYFDVRVRTEGFDLALLSAEAGTEAGVEATAQAPVMRESKSLITWEDVGHFAIISIGAGVLYLILIVVMMGALIPLMGATSGF